ncbi:ATP-binding protein [Diaphorobacter sp. NR2-3-3-1]|nr:ATP-binding protein [Diaphorobacter caeni]
MLESLRGLGYSTAAALADIIDNSIAAKATEVRLSFQWNGARSRILILDNGVGMNDAELEGAMRLGDKNPDTARSADDLGRFGMGLKTASFSQCRRLTVSSMKDGIHSCLRWDLDLLASSNNNDWLLFEGPAEGSAAHLNVLTDKSNGTLVLWETLDRIVSKGFDADDFNDVIDNVEAHLSMVFHRLLEGSSARLKLLINDRPVAPWDPFMSGHPGKPWVSPVTHRHTDYGTISLQCHVLPHRDQLNNDEFEKNAGPSGWPAQQGFYIYRNGRLLLAGGWLGLGTPRRWNRDEAHRLARIQLDIPNTADMEWKIDVRKSVARPPIALRGWLTAHATDTRTKARNAFAFRASPSTRTSSTPIVHAWRSSTTKAGTKHLIDRSHPAIAAALSICSDHADVMDAMLKIIEETVPVQRIWLDAMEQKESPVNHFAESPPDELLHVLQVMFNDMIQRRGMSEELARQALACTEPFQKYPDAIKALQIA